MNRLLTIYRQPDITPETGTAIRRKAYRAIIFKDDLILLIKSEKYGELKFPGGGKEANESAFQVLYREVMEETGYRLKSKIHPFASTMEYAHDFKGEFDYFIQDSRYYFCDIHPVQQSTNYSDYEIEYGYHPLWIRLEDAIANNSDVPANDLIPWRERDTEMLKILFEMRNRR